VVFGRSLQRAGEEAAGEFDSESGEVGNTRLDTPRSDCRRMSEEPLGEGSPEDSSDADGKTPLSKRLTEGIVSRQLTERRGPLSSAFVDVVLVALGKGSPPASSGSDSKAPPSKRLSRGIELRHPTERLRP